MNSTTPLEKPKAKQAKQNSQSKKKKLLLPENSLLRYAREVVFEFYNPYSKNVYVAGSFNKWHPSELRMIAFGEGEWSLALMLNPGRHEYRFVVDSKWTNDPNSPEHVSNGFGELNSVVQV